MEVTKLLRNKKSQVGNVEAMEMFMLDGLHVERRGQGVVIGGEVTQRLPAQQKECKHCQQHIVALPRKSLILRLYQPRQS
jgi:hypothetical protein